jgi:hypothetical protein
MRDGRAAAEAIDKALSTEPSDETPEQVEVQG